jgi:hypothetical protein
MLLQFIKEIWLSQLLLVTLKRATANDSAAVVGVFNGVFYNDPTTQKPTYKNYYPGGVTPTQGDITAFVVDDPDAVF